MIGIRALGEQLPKEMSRVRDEVLPAYLEIGESGTFAVGAMRHDLDNATKALAEGDVGAMIQAYIRLKEWHT